jgi:hypothetical protein
MYTVEDFVRNVAPRVRGELKLVREPYFEPTTVAFYDRYPDRLFCGVTAYETLRAKGMP